MHCRKCGEELNSFNQYPSHINKRQVCKKCAHVHYSIRKYKLKARREEIKLIVFNHYSSNILKCICCGEDNYIFLTLDHINNDGGKHRKELNIHSGEKYYRWLIKNNFPKGLQILCFNCNHGKALNNGICPHKTEIL